MVPAPSINAKQLVFIVFAIFWIGGNGQESGCSFFENGTFMAYVKEPVEITWKIIRKGNLQTEIFKEIPRNGSQEVQYGIIDWIDSCSYLFTFDGSRAQLSETQIAINETGGILVDLYNFDGNCIQFISYLSGEDEEVIVNGKLCGNTSEN